MIGRKGETERASHWSASPDWRTTAWRSHTSVRRKPRTHQIQRQQPRQHLLVAQIIRPAVGGEERGVETCVRGLQPGRTCVVERGSNQVIGSKRVESEIFISSILIICLTSTFWLTCSPSATATPSAFVLCRVASCNLYSPGAAM